MDIAPAKKSFEDLRLYIAQSFWSFWFGFSFETLKSILWHVWNLKLFDKFLFVFLVRTLLYNVPCKLLVSIIAIRISLQREKVSAQFIETVTKKFVEPHFFCSIADRSWTTLAPTEDGRSTSIFLLYWQLSQRRLASFPAFIASKYFDLWNHHIGTSNEMKKVA